MKFSVANMKIVPPAHADTELLDREGNIDYAKIDFINYDLREISIC